MEDTEELESFRRQWRQEVTASRGLSRPSPSTTNAAPASAATASQSLSSSTQDAISSSDNAGIAHTPRAPVNFESAFESLRHTEDDEEEEEGEEDDSGEAQTGTKDPVTPNSQVEAAEKDDLAHQFQSLDLGDDEGFRPAYHEDDEKENEANEDWEPVSAMDHYEAAVKKEIRGSMGDSVRLYRKALKLDADIEDAYRKKHFSHLWQDQPDKQEYFDRTQHAAAQAPKERAPEMPINELIDSFKNCTIDPADPVDETEPPAPCPISNVPSEIVIEILCHAALLDPATLPRISLVCKSLSYHVAREQRIWRMVCQSRAFGFGAMHYTFNTDLQGNELHASLPRYTLFPIGVTNTIPRPLKTWTDAFWLLPRIRFTGVYISTVSYQKQGMYDPSTSVSWSAPFHTHTYYRYLRFYPDGTVLVLLTITEPSRIVRHISKENLEIAKLGVSADKHRQTHDFSAPMANPIPITASNTLRHARCGRWRLTNPNPEMERTDATQFESTGTIGAPPGDNSSTAPVPLPPNDNGHDPRDVFIELTFNPDYTYYMHLSLRSMHSRSRKLSKNTKLSWQSYWSHNRPLDSWGQFDVGREKPYIFSRVKGWGMDIKE